MAEPRQSNAAMRSVMDNSDLVAYILAHADLEPWSFVAAGRVSATWHAACQTETLLLAAARRPDFLTKRTFSGLFALTSEEADTFPRGMRVRRPIGFMHMYQEAAISAAISTVGGIHGWKRRLAHCASRSCSPTRAHKRQRLDSHVGNTRPRYIYHPNTRDPWRSNLLSIPKAYRNVSKMTRV